MNKERTVQEDEELRKICEDYLKFGDMGDEGIQLRELQNIINILRLYEVGWKLSEAQELVDNLDTKSKIKDWNKENKSITQLLRSDNLKSVVDKELKVLESQGFLKGG